MQAVLDKAAPPLLLHFDVNRTIIQVDSVQGANVADGVREGIAELYWGRTLEQDSELTWEWSEHEPQCQPPTAGEPLTTYSEYCKKVIKNKKERKAAVRDFRLVRSDRAKRQMEEMVEKTMVRMQVGSSKESGTPELISIFPALFTLVAKLQRSKRRFAILFRSFGSDHQKVEDEWNAFCEMRHPHFSKLLEDIGPLDGSVKGVPDRRCKSCHTVYRDAEGLLLALNNNTSGPESNRWDEWARQDPKPTADTRDGRRYISEQLGARTCDGAAAIQRWMEEFLHHQGTAAIKDDWAWWSFNKESTSAGKPMLILPGEDSHQLFFDDNVEFHDPRIVDCRDASFQPVSMAFGMGRFYMKANPVEAVLDDDYFLRLLERSCALSSQSSAPSQLSTLSAAGSSPDLVINQANMAARIFRFFTRRLVLIFSWLQRKIVGESSSGGGKSGDRGENELLESSSSATSEAKRRRT
jgi:hypothetical protein